MHLDCLSCCRAVDQMGSIAGQPRATSLELQLTLFVLAKGGNFTQQKQRPYGWHTEIRSTGQQFGNTNSIINDLQNGMMLQQLGDCSLHPAPEHTTYTQTADATHVRTQRELVNTRRETKHGTRAILVLKVSILLPRNTNKVVNGLLGLGLR